MDYSDPGPCCSQLYNIQSSFLLFNPFILHLGIFSSDHAVLHSSEIYDFIPIDLSISLLHADMFLHLLRHLLETVSPVGSEGPLLPLYK